MRERCVGQHNLWDGSVNNRIGGYGLHSFHKYLVGLYVKSAIFTQVIDSRWMCNVSLMM